VAFWRAGHGDDWEQVIDADTKMFARFAQRGSDWFRGRLCQIACPILLTISLEDHLLPDPGVQVCHMVQQMPSSRAMIFPKGEHPLMWSRPEDFRRVAGHFLTSNL
jgi:pimeloyl-ACP methyl ester carboxylesterase